MPNKNYNAGRRLEWARKKFYEEYGLKVLRTAGSHGFADLIVVHEGAWVTFIQLKRAATEAAAKRLIKQFEANPPIIPGYGYALIFEVHVPRVGVFAAVVERLQ